MGAPSSPARGSADRSRIMRQIGALLLLCSGLVAARCNSSVGGGPTPSCAPKNVRIEPVLHLAKRGSTVVSGFRFATYGGECAARGARIFRSYVTVAGSNRELQMGVVPLPRMDNVLSSNLGQNRELVSSPLEKWCHAAHGLRLVLHADVRGGHRFASSPLICP